MEQRHSSKVVRQFKRTFSETALNALGKSLRFCVREREVTPHRLALGLIEVLATPGAATIADLQRAFNALCGTAVQYKPFHNQLAKAQFPEFTRALYERLLSELACEVLRFRADSPFAGFSHITLHDGSSFALKDGLAKVFPGRFTTIKPAAVELHASLELLTESLDTVVLTPDREAEVHQVPAAASLAGGLLLADRMFFIKEYLADIRAHGGHFLVRAQGRLNPLLLHAYRPDGREIKSWRGLHLNEVKARLSRCQEVDLDVAWSKPGPVLQARMVVSWDREHQCPRYLVTSLPREAFSFQQVVDAYRLRWQVELLFKEWKSYANLHAFPTRNPHIAEGLIWASLCAAALKRYCAHMSQRLMQVPISTRKVAMCAHHVLADIFHALLHRRRRLAAAVQWALQYLALNARRAHPKRDRLKGRLKLGLEHVYGVA